MALSNELIYRANFMFGRIREIIVFGAILYLFSSLPTGAGNYDQPHLLTYALAAAFISGLTFVQGMESIANEIADGDLVNYLLRPINYLWFWVFRLSASKFMLAVAGIIQVSILFIVFRDRSFFIQHRISNLALAIVMILGALAIIQSLDLIAGSLSFWTHRGHGARWMIAIFTSFLSGSYYPIDLFPHWIQQILLFTPFPSLVYYPVKVYLGDISGMFIVRTLAIQWGWVLVLWFILMILWRAGIKSYEAYGR